MYVIRVCRLGLLDVLHLLVHMYLGAAWLAKEGPSSSAFHMVPGGGIVRVSVRKAVVNFLYELLSRILPLTPIASRTSCLLPL